MPILPLIDLLILLSTGSLLIGFVLKAISITTRYRPALLGFTALDFVIIAGIFLAMVLVLAARLWVKANEPRVMARRHLADLHPVPAPRGRGGEGDGAPGQAAAEAAQVDSR